ncbi:MAG: prolipoprotein diacylglyceryl transferase [Phycisphaerae bacterium]|nr:prolipoprotein diacylglyceryl transferase [Phycisphaerae bacterium]
MTLAAWLHDLDPFALRLGPGIGLRWYGLSYAAAFVLGWVILRWLGKRGATRIPPSLAGDAILSIVVGVVVGGRLGYVFFYDPSLLTAFSAEPPFWGVLALHRGGMASHGGMIGVILAAFVIARRVNSEAGRVDVGVRGAGDGGHGVGRVPVLHVLDTLALLAPTGLLLGRIANFINGELLGRIVAMPGLPSPWWAVKFPNEVLTEHDPGRLMDPQAAADRLDALDRVVGVTGPSFEVAYERMLERLRHPQSAADRTLGEQIGPLISARHPSQLYQAVAEGVVLGAVLWLMARRARRPGTIGAWFLIVYGVLRVATEHWRLPDGHLAVKTIAGLSRGQWLSVVMVVAGAAALAIIRRRNAPAMGGWARHGAS